MRLEIIKVNIFGEVIKVFLFSILLIFVFFVVSNVQAQDKSMDAIAIRIIPNQSNFSAKRWYAEQGFTGSPQSLIVDGYEAIRDGRTIYVGASNIDFGNGHCSNDFSASCTPGPVGDAFCGAGNECLYNLYSNIYLISFNQEAEKATEDIFSQVISHWKFNTNITSSGYCRVNPYDPVDPTAKSCVLDSDCPIDKYCDSLKSRVVRDTKRLADLVDIKTALDGYKNKNGKYPVLSSGTYLPNITISTWPSWQKLLSQILNLDLPVDPVNKLGDCGDVKYHPITCWDEKTKEFADADSTDSALNLPNDSKVYLYVTENGGESYNICGTMESEFVSGAGSGACAVHNSITYDQPVINNNPRFLSYQLTGYPGEPFDGYIFASDPDGNKLTWTIDTGGVDWAGSGWAEAPYLSGGQLGQRNIISSKAGGEGSYDITVTINDGYGGVVSRNFTIQLSATPPKIYPSNVTFIASTTRTLNHSFLVEDKLLNAPLSIRSFNGTIPFGLSENLNDNGDGTWTFNFGGTLDSANNIPSTREYGYELQVENNLDAMATAVFNVTIINQRPIVKAINCERNIRTGSYYECQATATDPENNNLTYSISGAPFSLGIDPSTGLISGTLGNIEEGIYNIAVTATDNFGAVSLNRTLVLTVLNFCGDGERQALNTERRGGPANDGVEQCDGTEGVANNPAESSINKRYECSTPPGSECALSPADCVGTCQFTGGYCGDALVDNAYGEDCDHGDDINCCSDCLWSCPNLTGYDTTPLTFLEGDRVDFLNHTTKIFRIPACRELNYITATLKKTMTTERTAIVFVTDTSVSMAGSMDNVKNALKSSLNNFFNASDQGVSLHIGLVEYNTIVREAAINNVDSQLVRDNLVNTVDQYTAGGWTYTLDAVKRAHALLDNYIAEKKIIVLLSDGVPTDKTGNHLTQLPDNYLANNVKNTAVEAYTIAYTNDAALQNSMCDWSSDNGVGCYTTGIYAYTSTDADGPYTAITGQILTKPGAVTFDVGGVNQTINFVSEQTVALDLSDLANTTSFACNDAGQDMEMKIDFDGWGGIEVSNLELSYCAGCFGSDNCGDNFIQYPNSDGVFEDCDGSNLGSLDCNDLGYFDGNLICAPNCAFNTNGCCEATYGVWRSAEPWSECVLGQATRGRECYWGVSTTSPSCGAVDCPGSTTETIACLEGYSDCNLDPNDGLETDLNTDNNNCGQCNHSCASLLNSSCVSGSCQCDSGYHLDGGSCVPDESCYDGIKNQDEVIADLGGVCGVPPNFFISRHVNLGSCDSTFLEHPLVASLANNICGDRYSCLYDVCSDGRGHVCFYGDGTMSAGSWHCNSGRYITNGFQSNGNVWTYTFVNF